MNRLRAFAGAAALGLLLAACSAGTTGTSGSSASSGSASPLPTSVTSLPATGGSAAQTITVVGTGSVSAQPDTAVLTVGVTMTGATTSDAVNAAQDAATKLVNALVAGGVARDDITTTQYSVSPHWNPSTQRNEGWEVRDGFTAVVHDIGKVGSAIGRAATAVPNVLWVGGVDLQRTDTSAIAGPARDAALKDARAHAADWARSAGKTLGDIVSVSEAQGSATYTVPSAGAQGMGGGAGIVSGTGRYTVTVTVVFAVG